MTLHFAYGSNMSRAQMRARCPDHLRIGKAVLKDHALCFPRHSTTRNCGVAGLMEVPGAEVWGVLYRLHDEDLYVFERSFLYADLSLAKIFYVAILYMSQFPVNA